MADMKTVKLFTNQLAPGMVVAEDVFSYNQQLIASAGTTIDDKLITRFKFYSINAVSIRVEEDVTASPEAPIGPSETGNSDIVRNTPEFQYYKNAMPKSVKSLQKEFHSIVTGNVPDQAVLLESVQGMLQQSRNGIHVFDMIHCLRDYSDETYAHCLNVSLICYVLGNWLGYSKVDLEILTLSGLLHDIGKSVIPQEILTKPAALSADEYSKVKTHAVRGYDILRPQPIDNRIKLSAMMHHERCDGTGYPMNLKGNQIEPFAKIVAIADVYEAMTAARTYRAPICPFDVIHLFETEGLAQFDTHFLMCFLEHLNLTYINSRVRLSDGSEGKIVMMNRFALSRPIVKVGRRYIDLSLESKINIDALL
ncbi:MAG: HD-GYP domain-containing protein [Lachnospiraceae bacterium]|nr:HD-GYP domain-containing protein [Lachnospiraceae bacterium]